MKLYSALLLSLFLLFFTAVNSHSQFTKTVVSLTGNVIDEVTKEPAGVKILVLDNTGKIVSRAKSNKTTGYYYITGLEPGKSYTFSFDSKYYFDQKVQLELPNSDKYAEFSRDFQVTPLEENLKIPIQVAPFELNKAKLRYGSEMFLDDYADIMKENSEVQFKIVCYPDDAVSNMENELLTKERCQALFDFFAMKGVNPDRMLIENHSNIDPSNPPPLKKRAKGKRYIGPTYLTLTKVPVKQEQN